MTTDDRELRNAMLSAQQAGSDLNAISVTREQYAKQELGIEIPVDAVPLPSAGKVYPPGTSLHNATAVEYRSMTARDEDILMSRALLKKGTVITELLKSCITTPGVDVLSLLSGDRNALMIAVRVSGYGQDYSPTFSCPKCEAKNELHIDLAELPIKPLALEPEVPGTNSFPFKLPSSGKNVRFRFLTGREEEEILANAEMRKKKGLTHDNLVTSRLLNCIIDVDNNNSRAYVSKFVQYMPAKDSLALREYMDTHEPGVNMNIDFTCESCGHYEEVSLPFGPTFFWPNAR
jgi:hypothetical protein